MNEKINNTDEMFQNSVEVPKKKIGGLIGPAGKRIHALKEATRTAIKIGADNFALIKGTDKNGVEEAVNLVKAFSDGPIAGHCYPGRIVDVAQFGAFINLLYYKQGETEGLHFPEEAEEENEYNVFYCKGLVHRTEINDSINDQNPEDFKNYIEIGQLVWVMVLEHDKELDKTKLSMKCVDQNSGEVNPDFDLDEYNSNSGGGYRKRSPAPRRFGPRTGAFNSRDYNSEGGGNGRQRSYKGGGGNDRREDKRSSRTSYDGREARLNGGKRGGF